MKLWYDRKSKDPTYFVQLGIRNGKKTTTKNVARIGRHSELLKITDDPLAYAKEQVAKYNDEAKNNNKVSMEVSLDFAEKIKAAQDAASQSTLKNIGYLYLQNIYNQLELPKFFKNVSNDRKITFDPDLVNRFMAFCRILYPDSKLGSLEKLHLFYEQPDFGYQHIMRTMDLMYEHYNEYIAHLFSYSGKIVHRNTSVCYYDCTNYYCEAEKKDPPYVDEVTGEIMTGIRQYGHAKDHKPNPLVEMGLFMDTNGIPMSMCIKPGNTNEQTTAIPLEKDLIHMLGNKARFIYCADAGLSSYHIRNFNDMGGRLFVVTQAIKNLSEPLKQAVFNDFDYRLLSNDVPVTIGELKSFDRFAKENSGLYDDRAYKIIEANTLIDVGLEEEYFKNGKKKKRKSKATLKQHVIITFSRKSMEYQRSIRNNQIERAKEMLKSLDPETYKKGPDDVTRFIKKTTDTKDKYELDEEKIADEEKYDGFYAVATNIDIDGDVKKILAINEQRYKIEECFRILKTDFESRPYFHWTARRIIAHFMICYTALLVYRLLEVKLDRPNVVKHVTTRNIIETLQNMQVANIEDMCYASQYTGSRTLTALEAVFMLGLDKKFYLPKELNKKTRKNISCPDPLPVQ